jgi:hypothetical protein
MIYDRVLSFARHSMCTKQVLKLATAVSIYGMYGSHLVLTNGESPLSSKNL